MMNQKCAGERKKNTEKTFPMIFCYRFVVCVGSATVKAMRSVLSSRHVGAQGVYASCTTLACTSGSKAQTRAAVNCVNMTSSWRRISNPCARSLSHTHKSTTLYLSCTQTKVPHASLSAIQTHKQQ